MSFFVSKKKPKKPNYVLFGFFLIFEQSDFCLSPLYMVHIPIANNARMRVKRFRQKPRSCFVAPKYLPQRNDLEQEITLTDKTT